LPTGGFVAVFGGSSTLTAYFDESDGAGKLPITSVSGYVFEPERYCDFDDRMRELCAEVGIGYFRTSDCLHKSGEFKGFPKDVPLFEDVERQVISLVRECALLGVGAAVSEATFNLIRPVEGCPKILNTPYSMLCNWCLAEIGRWAGESNFHGDIAYFFEAGNKFQSQANAGLQWASQEPPLRAHYHYSSHSFVCKKKMRGFQAADLLAYFIRREGEDAESQMRKGQSRPRRRDFQALIGNTKEELKDIRHQIKFFDEGALKEMFSEFCPPEFKWY
jgi:hypothetical protein